VTAERLDIVIEQGTTFILELTYLDANDAPIDLSGYTAQMQIRPQHGSPVVLAEFSTSETSIIMTGAGIISIQISDEETRAYKWKRGVYDLEITSGGGIVTRLIEGSASVTPEVTK